MKKQSFYRNRNRNPMNQQSTKSCKNDPEIYADLARYLDLIATKSTPLAHSQDKIARYRQLNNLAKQLNFGLKYFSTFGLVLPLLTLLPGNLVTLTNSYIQLFLMSVLTKLFCVLVDLETKYVQYAVLLSITTLFLASNPDSSAAILGVSIFFVLFVTFSRYVKLTYKVYAFAFMVENHEKFHEYLQHKSF